MELNTSQLATSTFSSHNKPSSAEPTAKNSSLRHLHRSLTRSQPQVQSGQTTLRDASQRSLSDSVIHPVQTANARMANLGPFAQSAANDYQGLAPSSIQGISADKSPLEFSALSLNPSPNQPSAKPAASSQPTDQSPALPALEVCDSVDCLPKQPKKITIQQLSQSFIQAGLKPSEAFSFSEFVLNKAVGQSTVISGHGNYSQQNGTFEIPKGTSLTVYATHGGILENPLGNAIEEHIQRDLHVFSQTFAAGDTMPNYTVFPPGKLSLVGNPTTVLEPVNLKNLLHQNQGRVHLATCLFITEPNNDKVLSFGLQGASTWR